LEVNKFVGVGVNIDGGSCGAGWMPCPKVKAFS